MTGRLAFISLLLAMACAGVGRSRPEVDRQASEADAVIELERSYWAAEQRHDSAAVARLLAPDYVSMSSRGRTDRSKDEELALLFGGRVRLESFRFSAMRTAWVTPDVIALHYVVDQRFTLDGRALCPHAGSMTVWARRHGQWLRIVRTEYGIGSTEAQACATEVVPPGA